MIRIAMPFVSKAYGDTVTGKCPHLLDEPVFQLLGPFAGEEIDDVVPFVNELRPVPPP